MTEALILLATFSVACILADYLWSDVSTTPRMQPDRPVTCVGYRREPHPARSVFADDYLCTACAFSQASDDEQREMGRAASLSDDERWEATRA